MENKKPEPVAGTGVPTSKTESILSKGVKLVFTPEPPKPASVNAGPPPKRIRKAKNSPPILSDHRGIGMMRYLNSWLGLNSYLLSCNKEDKLQELLDLEIANRSRKMYILRIHMRFNRVRAAHERLALVKLARDRDTVEHPLGAEFITLEVPRRRRKK